MSLGIPYMGSKRKLSGDILHFITNRHNGITDFYDLFGGGGSISFTAVKDYKRITTHYNELNGHIYSLVKYLKENKTLEPKFYQWVTREMFFENINVTEANWYSGYIMSCWSFGNSQNSYLYGSDIEALKRLGHEFVVNGCLASMNAIGLNIPELNNIKSIQKRRIVFCDHIKRLKNNRFDLQHIERIQNLELIEHLARLQNLQITNSSYENVLISGNNPVIYCDIPYKGTEEYKEGGFDYKKFYQWFGNCPYPAYASEYDMPFTEVMAFTHRSSLSATNNKKKTIEKIFWNGKGIPNQTQLF
jgi:site-specific DNA-adenine methylase